MREWFNFIDWIHQIMSELGIERVETPTLVDCPGTEPDINAFETTHINANNKANKLFLNTSPEIEMKKLLCQGWHNIYEIKKCFRNKESGPINHNEFYLLEWYRTHSSLDTILKDLKYIFDFLSKKFKLGSILKIETTSMKELFKTYLNMEIHPKTTVKDFKNTLEKRNIYFNKLNSSIDDMFYLLFLNEIEPHIGKKNPLMVYDYPPFQKAYARIGENGWAKRFELFWKGMELANAFDEVIDSTEQKKRFKEDNLKRKQLGKKIMPFSDKLLKNMKEGKMPPSSGIAMGLERLFLAFKNLNDIKQVKLYK